MKCLPSTLRDISFDALGKSMQTRPDASPKMLLLWIILGAS
jgi:hypothetical protein